MNIDFEIDEPSQFLDSAQPSAPLLELTPTPIQQLRTIFAKGDHPDCAPLTQVDLDSNSDRNSESNGLDVPREMAITQQCVPALRSAHNSLSSVGDQHESLASRLAYWLRESRGRMTWENAIFHRDWNTRFEFNDIDGWSDVRLDVVSCAITPTARLSDLATYEVKVTVADFKADMCKPSKVQASSEIAQSAWYCTPEGLVTPDMLPPDFGLIFEFAPGEFIIAKRAKRKMNFVPHHDTLMALIRRRATLPESSI